jgi:hypothetical protein
MRTCFLLVPCLVLACSSTTGAPSAGATDSGATPTDDTGGIVDDTGAGEDVAAEDTTPPTPCGKKVGDTLCDLALQGYLRNDTTGLATSVPATTFKTSEALAAGTQPYAFIFNTAYW